MHESESRLPTLDIGMLTLVTRDPYLIGSVVVPHRGATKKPAPPITLPRGRTFCEAIARC